VEKNNGSIVETRLYLGGFEIFRKKDATGALALERETLHIMDDVKRIAVVETKTYENGSPILNPIPAQRYQLSNNIESAALELDENAQIISYEEYYPYGDTSYQAGRNASEASQKRYRYTGKEKDEESGLYYMLARYYAGWLGRWTAVDPAGLVDGVNLYMYCRGNPVILLDREGNQGRAPFPNPYDMEMSEVKKAWNYAEDKIKYNPISKKIEELTNSSDYRTAKFALKHHSEAIAIGKITKGTTNISTNAVRFSTRIGLKENKVKNEENQGSQTNAFRHALWQATINNQFGTDIAKEVGFAHEENPYAATGKNLKTTFTTMSAADETVDLLNNVIGRKIGEANPSTNMQELAIKTLDYFNEHGLWTVNKEFDENDNTVYTIVQEKLDQIQYDKAKKTLQQLNSNGFTPQEQKARDEAKIKQLIYIQSTWNTIR
jgi:RHS repeat-associated protein